VKRLRVLLRRALSLIRTGGPQRVPAVGRVEYADWVRRHDIPGPGGLARLALRIQKDAPRISVLMAVGIGDAPGLRDSLASLDAQVYPDQPPSGGPRGILVGDDGRACS
jgi:hypothetical protein